MNFLEYVGLQKSLRRVTEQKMELADQLKTAREEARKSEAALARSNNNSKMQLNVLKAAQQMQLSDKDSLIDSLKLSIEEMEENATGGTQKAAGIRQMVDTITKLSTEKREQFQRAEENDMRANNATEDLERLQQETAEKLAALQQELAEVRAAIDPVKLDAVLSRGGDGASSAEVEALLAENQKLKDRLEIVEAQSQAATADSGSGVSSAQATRLEGELKEKRLEVQQLRAELKDSSAKMAGLQAMSKSGSESDSVAKAQHDSLAKELMDLKKQARDQSNQLDELQSQLNNEKSAHARTKELKQDLQKTLDQELHRMQGAAAAGENDMAIAQSEAAAARSELKAERSAHEDAKQQLADSKKQVVKLKEEVEAVSGDMSAEMDAERQRHAKAIQNAKAEAAAQVAEARQRAVDEMKDLKQRMSKFSTVLAPMMATLKALKAGYTAARKDVRDLSATIAPAIKQVKRDLLKNLAEVDKQYKEMLHKYRKEMALRKKLHNELVDLKGNIRVFGRVRPPINEDGKGSDAEIVIVPDPRDDQLLTVDTKVTRW